MMPTDSEMPDSRVRVDLPDVDFLLLPWEYLDQPPEDAQSSAAETETEGKQESHETETDAEKHAEPSEEAQPQSIPDTAKIKACPVYTRCRSLGYSVDLFGEITSMHDTASIEEAFLVDHGIHDVLPDFNRNIYKHSHYFYCYRAVVTEGFHGNDAAQIW
ncbi:uncharacterized protein FSUBG_5930 [Fusarium subglutinans]|uniref:Uncharacterized protein n=1 Tax=Gibberella subglutinans TaxID=42677 RepID=A0A8H5Q2Q7_GIBSU|nr:uncharacterized protein FSUBG_5930 [Fusarium subglutinans]KAF5606533.1 hypothetical protein FSUBG_5930 [Fusarium subglutinans]